LPHLVSINDYYAFEKISGTEIITISITVIAIALLMTIYMVWGYSRRKRVIGKELMIGKYGTVKANTQWIVVEGENWHCYSNQFLFEGQIVKVIALHGLILEVEPKV